MKEPHTPKTKEQILMEMEAQQKAHTQRKFVREKFYPLLCDATTSINDADIFLQSFSNMVMESFMHLMKEKKFADLKITDKLDAKNDQYPLVSSLVNLFNEMTVNEAQGLIDGMKDELRLFYKLEMKERKLIELKTKWLE